MHEPIRMVTDADLDEILELNRLAVPAVSDVDRSAMEWFAENAHSFLVAPDGRGGVVGFLIGLAGPGLPYSSLNYQWFCGHYDRFVYVDRVVVSETARDRGLGTEFYDRFVELGRADGHDLLTAEVNLVPPNDGSLRFHDRYGFECVGEQDTEGGSKRVSLLAKRFAP